MDNGQWIGKKARIRKGLLLAIHHPLPTVRSLNEYYGVNTSPRARMLKNLRNLHLQNMMRQNSQRRLVIFVRRENSS